MSLIKDVTSGGVQVATEATAATLATEATSASIDGKMPALTGGRVPVEATVSGSVTVSSLPALAAGAATIGKIDQGIGGASAWKVDGSAVTQPVSGPLTDTQLRASAVPVSQAALTSSPWSTAAIGNLSSGDTTIVAGAGGQTIKVYGWSFGVAAAANVTLYDGAAGTAKTGAYPLVANQGLAAGPRLEPLFVCSTGNALVINSSAAVSAGGIVWYVRS